MSTSCETIAHEFLHVLGLADEYKEVTNGYYVDESGKITENSSKTFRPHLDCRSVGPDDSVMAYQKLAFERKSILYPKQFMNLIQTKECLDRKNDVFNTCGKNAYRTSFKEGCLEVPKLCKEEGGAWVK